MGGVGIVLKGATMAFNYMRCECGAVVVEERINLDPGEGKPFVLLARASICPLCRKVFAVKGASGPHVGGYPLSAVDRAYRRVFSGLLRPEDLGGAVSGNMDHDSGGYNPDEFLEEKRRQAEEPAW